MTSILSFEGKINERGMKGTAFDTALPQYWVDAVLGLIDEDPFGHVVWSYDGDLVFGCPRSIDIEGDIILGRLAARL